MKNILTSKILVLLSLLVVAVTPPTFAEGVDPVLVKALHQATRDEALQTTDLEFLTWLSDMATKLERRIPDPFYRIRLLKTVHYEAQLNGLDPQMVLAVMEIESNFNRYAISSAGAQGLMQVMPFWKEVMEDPDADLFNPLTSIQYGCAILRRYLDRFSSTEDALAAYNGSYGRTTYSDKVLRRWKSRWQYQEDNYNSISETEIAISDELGKPLAN